MAGPELIGRRVPPLVDRLLPVSHEKDRPLPLGILPHGAEDILDQRPKQGKLDLRRVLELVEEQMGRPVESQFVEARHEERPVGAVGPVEGDERFGDIVEIEPAEPFLLLGEHCGPQGAEALEKGAPQPFGVDEMLGDEAAHRGIELPQGGVGGRPAVGGGHLYLRQIGFEEERPFEIHRGKRIEEGGDHLRAQGSPRRLRDGPHLFLQPLVLGDEARLVALELVEEALGTVPSIERLPALVQRLDQRLGLHVEDARRDQDAFDVGENARDAGKNARRRSR